MSDRLMQNKVYEAAFKEVRRKMANERLMMEDFKKAQWRAGSNRKCSIAARNDVAVGSQVRHLDGLSRLC